MGVLDHGWQSPPYVALYVIGFVSCCCSCYVVATILRNSPLKVVTTRLIFYLHVTLIFEDFISMPYAYGDGETCRIVAFLWTYVSLSRIMIVSCMVVLYRNIIFENSLVTLKNIVNKYSEWIIFIFPFLPASTPWITGSFGGDGKWCAIIHGQDANFMAIIALYGWAWVLLTLIFFVLLRTVVQVYRIDREMTSKLFTSVGYYVVFAFLSWIPRTEERLYRIYDHKSNTGYYVDSIVLYGQGLIFWLVFIIEKNSITKFDEFAENNDFRFSEDANDSLDITRNSKSLFSNPFYRGSNVADSRKSTHDTGNGLRVTLVDNPMTGDLSHNSSSGKVLFEGFDDSSVNSNL